MTSLGDCHDWYLKADVTILSDVFTKFRKITMDKFGLDPLHYLTLPALSFDCLFKSTSASIELITKFIISSRNQFAVGSVNQLSDTPNGPTPGPTPLDCHLDYHLDYHLVHHLDYHIKKILYIDANNL